MNILDPGHIYELDQLGTDDKVLLQFLKRSGKLIKHDEEWDGLQTQEVIRALIDRTEYLNDLIPCTESQDAAYYLRMALFCYEVRAHRRKVEKQNRQDGDHDDTARGRPWRDQPYDDVPFNEIDIELRATNKDGHII